MLVNEINVFASNLAARFITEAQRAALRWHGAEPRLTRGPSQAAYAIPFWDKQLRTLPDMALAEGISDLLRYATAHPEIKFIVPRLSIGHPDISEEKLAQWFYEAPANCVLPGVWEQQRHPGLLRLLVVARWPGLLPQDYVSLCRHLNEYRERFTQVPALSGVWCAAYAQAAPRLALWGNQRAVPVYARKENYTRYGKHGAELLHQQLLMECTEILAMRSNSRYVDSILTKAAKCGIRARVITKPSAASLVPKETKHHQSRAQQEPPHKKVLRQPSKEDLEIQYAPITDPTEVSQDGIGRATFQPERDLDFGTILFPPDAVPSKQKLP